MTGNCKLISRHNWIYATYSGRGDQTAHTVAEIDKISQLDLLIISLSDSEKLGILNFASFKSDKLNDWQ